jgi:hypothetical protein
VPNSLAVLSAHGQDWLRWRNVVSRMLFNFIIRRLKTFSKVLLRVRQSVAVTHPIILADSEAVSLNRIPALLPFLAKPCA